MNNFDFLEQLNEEQIKAVKYIDGPLFVVAGAGTGKTRTLTNRVAYLYNLDIKQDEMLVLTFTNKAASEMSSRIEKILNKKVFFPYMSTFHSFAYKFLKTHASSCLDITLNRNSFFSVCDEYESKKILKQVLKSLKLEQEYSTNDLVKIISKFKCEEKPVDDEYTIIYQLYNNHLEENNLFDFDDLLIYTKKILLNKTQIKDYYFNKFKHILVDEFQDTDKIQYDILKILADKNKPIFVVGDPDQSIYSFRGALYENNDKFINDFNPLVYTINKNYRSTNNILKTANKLISHNKKRNHACLDKKLVSDRGEGLDVVYNYFKTDREEAIKICESIKYTLQNNDIQASDIAILIRSNYLSRLFEETLVDYKIPFVIFGGIPFFQRKEIKDFVAYLKVSLDSKNDYYFKRIINVPKRYIGDRALEELELVKITNKTSLYDSIEYIVNQKLKTRFLDFKDAITDIKQELNKENSIFKIVNFIEQRINYFNSLNEKDELVLQDRVNNVEQLQNFLTEQAQKYKGLDSYQVLSNCLEKIELLSDNDIQTTDNNAVVLSTYHQIKGLEFNTVYMPCMEEEVIPNAIILRGDDEEMEEERRIAYVGITRAKQKLYISATEQRYRFGTPKRNEKSRFIKEMQVEDTNVKNESDNNLSLEGLKVYHPDFKEGIIVSEKGDVLSILFGNNIGIKKILKTFKGLEIFYK